LGYPVTLDEAWFYFSNQYEQIWLPDHEDLPTIERQIITSPTTTLTMGWNPHRLHLANIRSKGQKWTHPYYIDHILPEIGDLYDARD
jgi:hypothetical protein